MSTIPRAIVGVGLSLSAVVLSGTALVQQSKIPPPRAPTMGTAATPTPQASVSIPAATPFKVIADHTIKYYDTKGIACPGPTTGCVPDTDSYALRMDGITNATLLASANTGGSVTFNVTSLPTGSHLAAVAAVGQGGTVYSGDTPFTVDPAPMPVPQAAGKPTFSKSSTQPLALTATSASWTSGTAATITAPAASVTAGDLVIAAVMFDAAGTLAPTASLTSTPALTWMRLVRRGNASSGNAEIWSAAGAKTGTVSVTLAVTGTEARALQLYRVTNGVTGPTWSGGSTTNPWNPTTYTSTSVGSYGLMVVADWAGAGLPTSADAIYPGHVAGHISWGSLQKKAISVSLAPVSFNVKSPGSPQWTAVAIEVKPK